jgi:hypothetical protein
MNFNSKHRKQVGTPNRTGEPYIGSYDIWTRNRISSLIDVLSTRLTAIPDEFGPNGWINGENYVQASENFGILPTPDSTRTHLGMLDFHPSFAEKKKTKHTYLARQQNTRTAVLPVHTKAERGLFALLVSDVHGLFAGKREPNWEAVASRWVGHSDGVTIFYKVRAYQFSIIK